MNQTKVVITLFLLTILFPVMLYGEEAERVIKGKVKVPPVVEKLSPPISLEIPQLLPWRTEADKEFFNLEPPGDIPEKMVAPLRSSQTTTPNLTFIPLQKVVTFHPRQKYEVKKWRLRIIDSQARVVKQFKERGRPPRVIVWDGMRHRKMVFRVGEPYSFTYTTWDSFKNKHYFRGKTFSLESYGYRNWRGLTLSLLLEALFKEEGTDLFRPGKKLLLSAVDMLREYPKSQFTIEVWAKEASRARRRAQVISDYLAEELIIGKDRLRTKLHIDPEEKYPVLTIYAPSVWSEVEEPI